MKTCVGRWFRPWAFFVPAAGFGMRCVASAQVRADEQDGIISDLLMMNIGEGSVGTMSALTFAFCPVQVIWS